MLQPLLPDEVILAHLRTAYQVKVRELEFLPLGADAHASVYRVIATNGTGYFLKVRQGALNEAGLVIPHYLKIEGLVQIVAPLPTISQTLWHPVGDYAFILYPYVAGRAGVDGGLSRSQWQTLGTLLRRIHGSPLPPALVGQLRRETFLPDWLTEAQTTAVMLRANTASDSHYTPVAQELAAFWRQKATVIDQLLVQTTELGQALCQRSLPHVLCHADLHTSNVLVDAADQIWLVDWDQVVLAPKERDLMFVVGGAVLGPIGDSAEAAFMQGYGECAIDAQALAYYRYAWAVQDIGAFADEILGRPDLGQAAKAQALAYFKSLFDPGMIVEAALCSKT